MPRHPSAGPDRAEWMACQDGSDSRGESGFTLPELIVVLAIFGVLVGLELPAVQAARQQINEERAVESLQEIAEAQALFQRADPDGDGIEDFARNLRELGAFGYLEEVVASGQKDGYYFTVSASSWTDGPVYVWDAVASPLVWGVTGSQHFHIDASGLLVETTQVNASGPLPGLSQIARTVVDELAALDPSGTALDQAQLLLEHPGNVEALTHLLDTNGDDATTLAELTGVDPLAIARDFLALRDRGTDPVIGGDELLEASTEKVLRELLRQALVERGVDEEPVAVPLAAIEGDPTGFLASPPAMPR